MLKIPDPDPGPPGQAMPVTPETSNFCPISLTDWLDLCRRARVPHVPAEPVTTINRLDWMMFDQEGPHRDRLHAARRELEEKLRPGHMFRFDFCAPLEVKLRMGAGLPDLHPDMTRLILDDPRAYDILYEFPREAVPVYQRPWLSAMLLDGYPVEYRVFVHDGEITGISNYYPQRPLPLIQTHLDEVTRLTGELVRRAETPFLWHSDPRLTEFRKSHDPDGVHFSADFIVTSKDEILFLEGGPPHELGAHPCCFQPGEIQGVALEKR